MKMERFECITYGTLAIEFDGNNDYVMETNERTYDIMIEVFL